MDPHHHTGVHVLASLLLSTSLAWGAPAPDVSTTSAPEVGVTPTAAPVSAFTTPEFAFRSSWTTPMRLEGDAARHARRYRTAQALGVTGAVLIPVGSIVGFGMIVGGLVNAGVDIGFGGTGAEGIGIVAAGGATIIGSQLIGAGLLFGGAWGAAVQARHAGARVGPWFAVIGAPIYVASIGLYIGSAFTTNTREGTALFVSSAVLGLGGYILGLVQLGVNGTGMRRLERTTKVIWAPMFDPTTGAMGVSGVF